MIYVEVSTLFEQSWSGIANVTANLCRALIERGEAVRFFAFDRLLKNAFVETALAVKEGAALKLMFDCGLATDGRVLTRPHPRTDEIGIYPNFRRGYQKFAKQVLIVHDISFSLMPELHRPGVEEYAYKVYNDAHEMDHVYCDSEASRRDLITYYRVPAEKVSVAHPGVDIDPACDRNYDDAVLDDLGLAPKSFLLVLGTIEPRKNVGLILQYLRDNPDVLRNYKVVFVGRDGWGKSFRELSAIHGIDDPRIMHLGYLSDSMCKSLLRHCLALVYPSLFEGFGMPVIEGMAAGVPVLVSRSSSLVELGIEDEWSFDPCSVDSFTETLERFLRLSPEARATIGARNHSQAARFTWSGFAMAVISAARSTAGLRPRPAAAPGSAGTVGGSSAASAVSHGAEGRSAPATELRIAASKPIRRRASARNGSTREHPVVLELPKAGG